MGRIKLKITRLDTIDIILDAYAKRKSASATMIQEALLREEKQKAHVQELEVSLKKREAQWRNEAEEIKNQQHDLKVELKNIEGMLSPSKKEVTSLHTTSEDLKKLHPEHDALSKANAACLKELVEKQTMLDELSIIADCMTLEERKKLASNIDVERAKVKQLEQNRKEIEKRAYLDIKEYCRKKLASNIDVERAKVKQLEQNSKKIDKGACL